jgi:hypothetical protein
MMEQPLSDPDISAMRSRLERIFDYGIGCAVIAAPIARLFDACNSAILHEDACEVLLEADFAGVLDRRTTERRGYHQPQIRAALAAALFELHMVEDEMLKDEGE